MYNYSNNNNNNTINNKNNRMEEIKMNEIKMAHILNELDKSGDDENESDIGELFAMLGEVMHSIFGDSVTVHVFSE